MLNYDLMLWKYPQEGNPGPGWSSALRADSSLGLHTCFWSVVIHQFFLCQVKCVQHFFKYVIQEPSLLTFPKKVYSHCWNTKTLVRSYLYSGLYLLTSEPRTLAKVPLPETTILANLWLLHLPTHPFPVGTKRGQTNAGIALGVKLPTHQI